MEIIWGWRTEAFYSIIHDSIAGDQHRRPASPGTESTAQVVFDDLDGNAEGGVTPAANCATLNSVTFRARNEATFGGVKRQDILTPKEP
jgi:hypothetical protein